MKENTQNKDPQEYLMSGPSVQMAALETNKHYKNNPLKDISNQLSNKASQQERGGYKQQTTPPFEIAPKQLKINNFFDPPSKQGEEHLSYQ
jgi:hypothetical protein